MDCHQQTLSDYCNAYCSKVGEVYWDRWWYVQGLSSIKDFSFGWSSSWQVKDTCHRGWIAQGASIVERFSQYFRGQSLVVSQDCKLLVQNQWWWENKLWSKTKLKNANCSTTFWVAGKLYNLLDSGLTLRDQWNYYSNCTKKLKTSIHMKLASMIVRSMLALAVEQ